MKSEQALAVLEETLLAAREAALDAAQSNDAFERGRVMAYYDVLTVALQQAEAMGLDPAEIGLDGFDPDDLLRHTA